MAIDSLDKGRRLENAVKFIQETILSSDPQIKGSQFTIETNVRDKSSGVLHEIDVLVKTHPNSSYEATWIFECKNWAKPVDKNQVIVLAEKVEALRAGRGFLVAKSISKEAEAQFTHNPRLRFVRCTEDFWSPFNSAQILYSSIKVWPMQVKVRQRGVPPSDNPKRFDAKIVRCRVNNEPVAFLSFLKPVVDEIIREDQNNNAVRYLNEGTHDRNAAKIVEFTEGEFVLDDMDVESLVVAVYFWVTVRKKKILSKFEFEGQGRVFSFEPIESDESDENLEITLVQRL